MPLFFSLFDIYNRLTSWHWMVRYGLLLALISVVSFAWYMLVYQRLGRWQQYYVAHYAQRVKQRKLLPTITKRITSLSQQKRKIEGTYKRISSELDTICHKRLLEISLAISQYGMRMYKASGDRHSISSGYCFTFYGTPEQLHYFFEKFFQDTFYICTHLLLTNYNESHLECTCILEAYPVKAIG